VEFVFSEYAASGSYALSTIRMSDRGHNHAAVRFVAGEGENPQTILVETSRHDAAAPELDLDNVLVSARTLRPEAPDGETLVSVAYYVRDDGSGLGPASFNLRDPQGVDHLHYHYHANFHGPVFKGDPSAWTRYEMDVLLPAGSVSGVWGLSSMQLADKVGNRQGFDFTETLRFEVLE
jgi:hypothetical protein